MKSGKPDVRAAEAKETARRFLEIVPRTMRSIRCEVRSLAPSLPVEMGELTLPQIRVMAALADEDLTNSQLAERLTISVPAMSRMVDGLVRRGHLVRDRNESARDRRQIPLALSPHGRSAFNAVMRAAESRFARRFSNLSASRRRALEAGLSVLSDIFSPGSGETP